MAKPRWARRCRSTDAEHATTARGALGGVEGARRHPAPAAPVHAVRDRGALAGAAARRRDAGDRRLAEGEEGVVRRRGRDARWRSSRSSWWRCATCASRTNIAARQAGAGGGARRAPRSSTLLERLRVAAQAARSRSSALDAVARRSAARRSRRPRWCRAPKSSCRSRGWWTWTRSARASRARRPSCSTISKA